MERRIIALLISLFMVVPAYSGGCRDFGRFSNISGAFINVVDYYADLSNFTFTAWVYPETNTAQNNTILRYKKVSGGYQQRFLFTTDHIESMVQGASGYKYYRGNSTLTAGAWYHLAMRWDGTTFDLFVNGEKDTPYDKSVSDATVGTIAYGEWTNTDIGAFYESATGREYDTFDGRLADVRIYGTALTDAQVYEISQGDMNVTFDGIIQQWPLDDPGQNPTYRDVIGGYTGALGGDTSIDERFDGPPIYYGGRH